MSNKEAEEDLDFVYDDSDDYEKEISELYTYTEEPEFEENLNNFKEILRLKEHESWSITTDEEKKTLLQHIVQVSELSDKVKRNKAISSLLYLVQGVYGECDTVLEQKRICRNNCFLLYKHGIFAIMQGLLMMEINVSVETGSNEKKPNLLSLEGSKELRHILSILYTMVETLRHEDELDTEQMRQTRRDFLLSLEQNLNDKEPLIIVLFSMVSKFCSQTCSNFPMKKVIILIWKLVLVLLGGFRSLQAMKNEKRREAGLTVLDEDSLKIVAEMKASNPPTSATDLLDISQLPSGKRKGRKSIMYMNEMEGDNTEPELVKAEENNQPFEEEKVTSIDDAPYNNKTATSDEQQQNDELRATDDAGDDDDDDEPPPAVMTPMPTRGARKEVGENLAEIAARLDEIRAEQVAQEQAFPRVRLPSGLPWVPKARQRDVEAFFDAVRHKFIGYVLPGDLTTVAGLPKPTQDSIAILHKYVYTSLSDLQVQEESDRVKCPLTLGKNEQIPDTVAERLYQALLPNLPQYMIALLKILLAAAPTSKAKGDSINILSDVLPADMPSSAVLSLKLGIDVNRHREIIVKSISAVLLLLLKHFKLSHVYQFEYTSQHLVFANCIPLVLKFFNQNIVAFITTKNLIPALEFPYCVIGEQGKLTADSFESVDAGNAPCWRNLFSTINLLRILNKLVKWKHSRTMMLVVFKSAPILKRALKVRHAMFQLYLLKLLKVQTKYLGRAWRKTNMKSMSAIYQKVRHRLNDDWAYGNDVDARPWDFQQEECALRACVERFNLRRYRTTGSNVLGGGAGHVTSPTATATAAAEDEYAPVNNNLQTLLNEVDLPEDFGKSYSVWLEREVYESQTDWDALLSIPTI